MKKCKYCNCHYDSKCNKDHEKYCGSGPCGVKMKNIVGNIKRKQESYTK